MRRVFIVFFILIYSSPLYSASFTLRDIEDIHLSTVRSFNQYSEKTTIELLDIETHENDYFLTPREFTSIGGGDCDDFVIYNYVKLLELGVDKKRMWFVSGKSEFSKTKEDHAVLMVEFNKRYYILDSLYERGVYPIEDGYFFPITAFNDYEVGLLIRASKGERFSFKNNFIQYSRWKSGREFSPLWKSVQERISE